MSSYNNDLKKNNYGDLILETVYWTIFLAPNHCNLGTCVIALKRLNGSLKGIKGEEWLDFGKIAKTLEFSLERALNLFCSIGVL